MHEHDHSYKLLFSHAAMIEDLLRGFVHEAWINELDFATLEKVNNQFISDDLRERENDLIWRVRWSGEWLYIYILLEFQSTVAPFMAVRMMTYLGLLYQDLIKHRQLTASKQLPPVLPLVLYNGRERWQAALNICDLIPTPPRGLEKYRPQLEYLLLDEGALSEVELLAPGPNLVAALFRLEQSRTVTDIQQVLTHLLEWLSTPQQERLRRDFATWLRRVILPKRLPHVLLPQLNELQEMHNMLSETVQQWYAQAEAQGLQQGIQQGKQEGQLEGERLIFKSQLQTKFGPLSLNIEQQIDTLDTQTLLRCANQLLTATTIEEVFANYS
jgi:predicted transposase/invertase (TIGR01784 family)